ncbi:MAG: phage holin family protein [Nitrospirota bacterium]|nr:phage holin family protein [Nitrospirota bacterium]MDE3119854.1 phage holin family protein [Nitrospirota bacterium]MDE3226334.1 phage holin family protein [Nitrospirota bacterium]MDE3243211.1 phage holin family protein [Nitrospirota bacterium]
MRGLLIRFTVTGIAVFLASQIVPGITVETVSAGVAAVILLAFLNAIVRPVLYLFSLPFIVLSLGLFMVVINALLLHVVAWLVKGFVVEGFWPSVWGALIISVTSTILTLWVSEQGHVEMVIHRKPPRIIN